MKLNLGCGQKKFHLDGWVNVDMLHDADQEVDLTLDWPWEDGSVDEIRADNLFEHFDNDEFLHVMNEAHRVIRPGGRLWFRVPDAERWPDGAWGDPTHKRYFFPRSFAYFNQASQQWQNYGSTYGFLPWEVKVERVQTSAVGKFFEAVCAPVKQ